MQPEPPLSRSIDRHHGPERQRQGQASKHRALFSHPQTTLLNVLCQRAGGQVSGQVRINGVPATKDLLKHNVGYVHQHVRCLPRCSFQPDAACRTRSTPS